MLLRVGCLARAFIRMWQPLSRLVHGSQLVEPTTGFALATTKAPVAPACGGDKRSPLCCLACLIGFCSSNRAISHGTSTHSVMIPVALNELELAICNEIAHHRKAVRSA